jgi:uncharacterized membrane protein (DUF2068 family)
VKRPIGVVFSAVVLILGSLFHILMALGMALGGVFLQNQLRSRAIAGPPIPATLPIFMFAGCVFLIALAVWGIATAVGLFRMRRWARYSVLVIGGGLALIGLFSMLAMLMMLAVPLPLATGVDPVQAHTAQAMTRVVFGVMAFLYAIVSAVGISWLVYFNRKTVREAFSAAANSTGEAPETRRPFLISLLAVLNLIGAVSCLLMVFLPFPGIFFGWILHGWQRVALYLAFAVLATAIGVGLWQLREWGRRLALGYMAFGLVYSLVFLLWPGLMLRYIAEIDQIVAPMQSPLPQQFQTMMYNASFGFSILYLVAVAWVLIHYRKAFEPPTGAKPDELTPLA